jgi:hypothetical protein
MSDELKEADKEFDARGIFPCPNRSAAGMFVYGRIAQFELTRSGGPVSGGS